LDNREGQRVRSFAGASAARYEGIVDTFVQLFPPRSAGLIAHVQGAELSPKLALSFTRFCICLERVFTSTAVLMALRTKKGMVKAMRVLELQPGVRNEGSSDERWLVAKAKSGHEDAFGELYKRHQFRTYRTALRILRNQQDAEDAAQRAFQRALVNLERFREDSTFSTWLTRIAINEALMLLRQRRRWEPLLQNRADADQGYGDLDIADCGPTPEEVLCETERRAALLQAVGQLRENLRIIVLHRDLNGLTSAETAKFLGLTVGVVKARAFHARKSLRRQLERKLLGAHSLSDPQKRRA
jgi:RNA polymerase sigma-70 factor (ECF subfamily)